MNTDRIIASVLSLVSAPLGVPFFYTGRVGLGIFCLICTFGFHDPKLPILFGVIFFIKLVLMTDERFQRKYRMSFAGKQNCKKTKVEIFRQFTPPVYVQPKEKFSRSGFEARSRMQPNEVDTATAQTNDAYKSDEKTSALAAFKKFDIDKAIYLFENQIKTYPKDGEAHWYLARCYSLSEQNFLVDEALENMKSCDYTPPISVETDEYLAFHRANKITNL